LFRTFRILSVFLVTALAVVGLKINFKSIGQLSQEQKILLGLMLFLGITNILVEIFDHRHQKRDSAKREQEFKTIKYQLSRPILPFTLRSFLKYNTRPVSIQYAFGDQIESFQKIIDHFKHAGKFMHPDLIDFPWDENHQVNEYIVGRLDEKVLAGLLNSKNEHKNFLLKPPFSGEINLFKKTKTGFATKPDLKLCFDPLGPQQPSNIVDLRLYNDNLYLEFFNYDWIVKENTDQLVSIYDLRGAMMKLKFEIITHDETDFERHPYFTLLQFKCGAKPFNILQLDLPILGRPRITKNEVFHHVDDPSKVLGDTLTMNYEVILPDNDLEDHMEQFNM
jgi:hypothetical protein